MRRLCALLLAVLVACGGGGPDLPDGHQAAAEAVETGIRLANTGQYGRLWQMMVPEHQELVDREAFGACVDASGGDNIDVERFEVVDTFEERRTVAGVERDVVAVTYELEVSQGLMSDTVTDTASVTLVDGEWRLFLVGCLPSD